MFICATALLLQVAVLVTRSNSTPQFPYEIFWPYDHVPEIFKRFKKMDNVLESIFGTINLQIPTMPPKVTSPITLNLQNLQIPPKTVSLSTRFLKNEKKLEKECVMHGVQYYQPVEGESIRHNKKRRKLMR